MSDQSHQEINPETHITSKVQEQVQMIQQLMNNTCSQA
jgi:hypothetical protein